MYTNGMSELPVGRSKQRPYIVNFLHADSINEHECLPAVFMPDGGASRHSSQHSRRPPLRGCLRHSTVSRLRHSPFALVLRRNDGSTTFYVDPGHCTTSHVQWQ